MPTQWEDIYEDLDIAVHKSNIYMALSTSKITLKFSSNHFWLLSDPGIMWWTLMCSISICIDEKYICYNPIKIMYIFIY